MRTLVKRAALWENRRVGISMIKTIASVELPVDEVLAIQKRRIAPKGFSYSY